LCSPLIFPLLSQFHLWNAAVTEILLGLMLLLVDVAPSLGKPVAEVIPHFSTDGNELPIKHPYSP
jgi:hypothetical protein